MTETAADLESFFDTDDFAIVAHITGAGGFDRSINAIFDDNTDSVGTYGDTDVEVDKLSFECPSVHLRGVKRGFSVTFPEVESDDPVFGFLVGHTYQVKRIAGEGIGTSRVSISE